jgi:2-hydroxychromene-2-carboxylate isomerase
MANELEFFFDYVSPYSHVANAAVKDVIERTGARLIVRPMFLGGVMQATGNRPPGTVAAKAAYMGQDLARCTRRYGIRLTMNPHFPMNTRGLTRATIGLADDPDRQRAFMDACFDLCWARQRPINPADPEELSRGLSDHGFDPSEIQALAEAPANRDALRTNTEEAVERGVFGSPSFFVGDALFFGHDRLDFAEALLA